MTAGAVSVPTIIPLRAPVPGVPKTAVDTDTKIELHSETSGVTIYYTLNGEKPEPFGGISPAAKATFVYREPFLLPGGKRTIKAVAVSPDHRESFVVTKVFEVQQLESSVSSRSAAVVGGDSGFIDDGLLKETVKREVRKFANQMVTGKEAWAEVQRNKHFDKNIRGANTNGSRQFHGEPRFLNNRFGSNGQMMADKNEFERYKEFDHEISSNHYLKKWKTLPDEANQALRLQKETDFLRCSHCFAPRPSDPFVRFCNDCGQPIPPLPQTRLPPPAPEQMGICFHCGTSVPLNTSNCLVCEAPLRPQNVPGRTEEKLLCAKCGTPNPADFRSCVGCAAALQAVRQRNQPPRISSSSSEVYVRSGDNELALTKGQMLICSQCGRVNNPEARFCDWCGTKSSVNLSAPVFCSKCHASNSVHSQFCNSCGVVLSAPMRTDLSGKLANSSFPQKFPLGAGEPWMPVNMVSAPFRSRSDAMTQTVGLFFPSEKTLRHANHDLEEKMNMEKELRDRKPMLTAISPGRGYWRKQLEHVCAHLKAHASNDADFRALIGEPRMGKLLSAIVNEDGYELNLTLSFVLREPTNDDGAAEKQLAEADEFLKSLAVRQRSASHRSQEDLSVNSSRVNSGRKKLSAKAKKTKTQKFSDDNKISAINMKLLKELGKMGEGRMEMVSKFIQEGADPNCVDKDGVPVLFVGALNKHVDALPLLIQEGANVNQTGPNKGNTVLHEVASIGNSAMIKVIEVLLGCGANPSKKNYKDETAYDIAVKAGCDSIAKKLAAHVGQSALLKLIKPRRDEDDPY